MDGTVPTNQQPTLEEGANDVPIVNITAPSPGGVSHNTFREYNVDPAGVVFNNNHDYDPNGGGELIGSKLTQQPLMINENLQGRAADIILTEVSGANPSNLLGYTEIYGAAADFILANPNGIYCDGAGFINAHRVTLTTGLPQLDCRGVLEALRVEKGTIEISDKGLSTAVVRNMPALPIDILSRALKISASFWVMQEQKAHTSNEVNIYTGTNKFDYATKQLTPQPSNAQDKPSLAIDASLVGNVSARKILIVATEKGVGVNMPALVADADNIEITAEGTIQLRDLQTAGDLRVESHTADVAQVSSRGVVQGALNLRALQGHIDLSAKELYVFGDGQMASKQLTIRPSTNLAIGTGSAVDSAAKLRLQVQDSIVNQGKLIAPAISASYTNYWHNQGGVFAHDDLHLHAKTIHNTGDLVVSRGCLRLTATDNIQNKQLIASAHPLTLEAGQELLNEGTIKGGDTLVLTTGSLNNSGSITGHKTATIQVQEAMCNAGTIYSAQEVQMQGSQLINAGQLAADKDLQLAGKRIENTNTIISQEGDLVLNAEEKIHNDRIIQSGQCLKLQAGEELTNLGALIAQDVLQVEAPFVNNRGTIFGKGNTQLIAEVSLYNQGEIATCNHLQLKAFSITNTGAIKGDGSTMGTIAHDILAHRHLAQNHDKLHLEACQIVNQGAILSRGNVLLVAQNILDNDQRIASGQQLKLQSEQLNKGHIQSEAAVQLHVSALDNAGAIHTPSLTHTGTPSVHNQGVICTQHDLKLSTKSLHNTGTVEVQQGDLSLCAQEAINNTQLLASVQDLALEASKIENEGTLQAQRNLNLQAGGLVNTGKIQNGVGVATLQVEDCIDNQQDITSVGRLHLMTGKLINTHRLTTNGQLELSARAITNQGVIAGDIATITASENLHNEAHIQGCAALYVKAHQVSNQGQLKSKTDLALETIGDLKNEGEIIVEECDITLDVGGAFDNHNVITNGEHQRVQVKKAFANTEQCSTPAQLVPTAHSVTNAGTITSQGTLTNTHTISSGQGLHIEVAGAVINAHGSRIAAVGAIDLRAGTLANSGAIASERCCVLAATHDINNQGTIVGAEEVEVKDAHSIHNTGRIHSGQDLTLQASVVDNQGALQADQGNITLKVSDLFKNSQSIISPQDLNMTACLLENTGRLVACRDLQIVATHKLTNAGDMIGGQGVNLIQAQEANNSKLIGSAKHLTVVADILNNHDRITANAALALHLKCLTNQGNITGGQGTTNLVVAGILSNHYIIAGVEDLHIDVQEGGLVNDGTLKAASNLRISAATLDNKGAITGGDGGTKLTTQGKLDNVGVITSAKNLHIDAKDDLTNRGRIAAENNLRIVAPRVLNLWGGRNAKIETLQGITSVLATAAYIENNGSITSADALHLEVPLGEDINNSGSVQGIKGLSIIAKNLNNTGTLFSGKNMDIRLVGCLSNNRGDIFSQGHIMLQGRNDPSVQHIKNYVGRIEAMGDITMQAHEVENKGVVSGSYSVRSTGARSCGRYAESDWVLTESTSGGKDRGAVFKYTYDDQGVDGWLGTDFTEYSEEPVSSKITEQAHINARGNLNLDLGRKIHNYGSVIVAGKCMRIKDRDIAEGDLSCYHSWKSSPFKYFLGFSSPGFEIEGVRINNELPYENVCLRYAHTYVKTWVNRERVGPFWRRTQCNDCIRKFRKGETFRVESTTPVVFRAGSNMHIQARELTNRAPITSVQIAHQASPLEELAATQTISVTPHIILPTSVHGLFRVNLDASDASEHHVHTLPSLAVQVDLPPLPPYATPTPFRLQEGASLSEDMPTDFAPIASAAQIKLPPLPPTYLIEANVKVDSQKFYGSPYFIKKLRIEADRPLRFVGDPFYESRLINESIQKATHKSYLNDAIATDEEQVKYLIDNTAEVAQDLNLALGVTLSKEQIDALQKDILWYVEETVHDQKVLTPQVYLTKATIERLQSPDGTDMHAGGQMHLDIKNTLTNTGHISARGDMKVDAAIIRNEGLGKTPATLQSTAGQAIIQAENDISNLSGKVAAQAGLSIKSKSGSVFNTTKVHHDGTQLLSTASIETGGDLVIKAEKGDFINSASRIQAAAGSSDIQARDILFDTQALKKETYSASGSNTSILGVYSSSSRSSATHTSITQEGCDIAIEGNSKMQADRDITWAATNAKVGGSAAFDAGRDFTVLSREEVEEDHYHCERHSGGNELFSSSSRSKVYDKKTRAGKQKGTSLNIGGNLDIKSGRDSNLIGVRVEADDVTIDVQGKVIMGAAYDNTHAEVTDTEDTHDSSCFGITKNDHGHSGTHTQDHTTGVGNTWRVRKLKAHGTQGLDTEKIAVRGRDKERAEVVSFTSSDGDVRDHAAMGKKHNHSIEKEYQEKRGLLGGGCDKRKGLHVKLYEKDDAETVKNEDASRASVSTFLVDTMEVKSDKGKVTLEGTDLDASHNVVLSGHKGVDIVDVEENTTTSEQTEREHKESYVGVNSTFVHLFQDAKAVKESTQRLHAAKDAYRDYKLQLAKAKTLLSSGHITQEAYDELAGDEASHIAAISAAPIGLFVKGKQLLNSAVGALASVATGGLSVTGGIEIEESRQQSFAQRSTKQAAKIRSKHITIQSGAGDANLYGSHLEAEALTLDVENVTVAAGVNTSKENASENGTKTTVTTEIPISALRSAAKMCAQGHVDFDHTTHIGESYENKKTYSQATINVKNLHLKVRGDTTLSGACVHAEDNVSGDVKGNVLIATLQGDLQAKSTSQHASVGAAASKCSASLHAGSGINRSRQNAKQAEQVASFTSGKKFDLQVTGKVNQVAAKLGSQTVGQSGIKAQEITKQGLVNTSYSNHRGVDAHVRIAGMKDKDGYMQRKQHAHASAGYGFHHTMSKLSCDGEEEAIYDTGTELAIDADGVRLVADPLKAGEEAICDAKTLYSAGEGIVDTLKANTKDEQGKYRLGTRGVLKGMQYSVEDAAGIRSTVVEDQEVRAAVINDATHASPEVLEQVLNQESQKLQTRAGAQNIAGVTLYQGEDAQFAGSSLRNYAAGYDTTQNEIYLNTQGTDLSRGGDVMASIYHEAQRKENQDNAFLSKLSDDQKTNLARFRGDRAQKVYNRLNNSRTATDAAANAAWNVRHQPALAHNNATVARAGDADVEPRVLEHFDPRYRQAVADGDADRAAALKALWDAREDTALGFVPVVGSACQAVQAYQAGEKGKVALHAAMAAGELVVPALVGKGFKLAKQVCKRGAQVAGKQAFEQVAVTEVLDTTTKEFKGHAVNSAITRGFKSADILKIMREGKAVQATGRYGLQTRYILGGNTVVVNAKGEIVTIFSNISGTTKGLGKGFLIGFK